jgi:carboxyl-terminal processing protease
MTRVGRRLLLVGLAGMLGLAALGIHYAMRMPQLSPAEAARQARLNGVWRSRGYGWLWEIADGRVRVFDESGAYCIARPDVRQKLQDLDDDLELSADGRRLRLPLEDSAYRFTFDKIDALPAACTRPPESTPAAVIAALGDIFSAHYAFFAARHVDWPALLSAAQSKVQPATSEADLLGVVQGLLGNFDDDHVSLRAKIKGRRVVCNTGEGPALKGVAEAARQQGVELNDMIERWKQTVLTPAIADELFDGTLKTTANGNVKYGLIHGDIGYLGLLSMEEFDAGDADEAALNDALDEAMTRFEGAKAVIVDVSLNDGGEDTLARAIAARFAAKRTLVYSKFAGDAPDAVPQPIYVEPSSEPRFTGPVYLITSNVTVSAAEVFTLAMRALPNVTHVGQRTRGSLSDVLTKRLPNGWFVTLSNEIYRDADGKAWEGAGIPPTVTIPLFTGSDDAASSHAKAVRAVVARIG